MPCDHDLWGSEFQIATLDDLMTLDFSHSLLTDSQFAQYPLQKDALANLRSLNLNDTKIGDSALAHLIHFTKLTELNLSHTNVTGAGLAHLVPLKELTTLNLSLTDIGDKAIMALAQLSRLQFVHLELTAVSDEGVDKLQNTLPNATIIYGASDACLKQALVNVIRSSPGSGARTTAIARSSPMLRRIHLRERPLRRNPRNRNDPACAGRDRRGFGAPERPVDTGRSRPTRLRRHRCRTGVTYKADEAYAARLARHESYGARL